MSDLTSKKCVPCSIGAIPLNSDEIQKLLKDLNQNWKVKDDKQIEREFKFKNFQEALGFTNRVGAVAEEEGHQPDICLTWGKVTVQFWTHNIEGLHENDFIMAAKTDTLYESLS